MKKLIVFFLLLMTCFALGFTVKEKVIENFNRMKKLPSHWWVFGDITPSFGQVDTNRFLKIIGVAKNWYVGGLGAYIVVDGTEYNTFEIDVKGNGKIKVQLFDDDNNNDQIEQDDKFNPTYDDRWECEEAIDTDGCWEKVDLPLSDFNDMNPGIGNDVFDIDKNNGSGGLVQMQFIFIAPSEKGNVNINIDNIKLINK